MNWFNVLITINLSLATIEVQRCPSNGESWKLSSDRIGCNKTHPYHCLPNNNLTSYVELCYKHTFFIEGGCLKYLDSGYIDQVKCAEFVCGCPDKSYYGDELFQYPMCLDLFIPGSCFTAHIDCLKLRYGHALNEGLTVGVSTTIALPQICNTTNCVPDKESSCTCLTWISVTLIMFGTSVALSIFYYCVPRLIRHMKTESKPSLLEQLKEACRDGDVDKYFTLKERDNSLLSAYVDKNGWSLLHHAAYGGSEIIFKDLLEQEDFDIHKKTKSSKTVLHIAAKEGRKEICRLIIDNTEYENLLDMKNDKDMNAGHIAARYGQTDIIEMLMKTRCDLLEKVGPLLENIAIFACKGRSLETMTFIGSHQNLKVALHEKNYQGWNVAHYAAKSGNCEILEYLIAEEGVDCINESTDEKKNCLHTACENGHYEACKCLIKNNSGLLHLRDINRNHAGHYAAKNGNITIIKYLKDQGLDLELTNKENVNILHISCLHAHLELFKYLAKEFPRLLNQKSNKSKNAVLFVMQRKDDEDKRIKILSYLVNRGLDVYHVPASGKSALYLACKNRAYSLCEHLLKNYPKFYDIDEGDLTAIEAADNDSRIKVLFSKYDPKHKTSSRYMEKICVIL